MGEDQRRPVVGDSIVLILMSSLVFNPDYFELSFLSNAGG